MKNTTLPTLITTAVLGVALFCGQVVYAQSEPTEAISQKESIRAEIAEVRRTYQGQLAEYRKAESQFTISKGQFEKLNTLSSLEIVVQDFRQVMSLRSQVLLTYLKLIELELIEADGINLQEKTIVLERTLALQSNLAAHKDSVDKAVDRALVNKAADDFVILEPQITNLGQYASTLLTVGRLQTIYDQALTLVIDTDPALLEDQSQSVKLNELMRAHDQIEEHMAGVNDNLRYVWAKIEENRLDDKSTNISKESASIYAELSQALTFLQEILQ